MTSETRSRLGWALGLSGVLFLLRWNLAGLVGFGDAEALYVAYALHPQPAYLDHPGLVGAVARVIGGGEAPDPIATHHATAVLATLLPWLGLLAARAAGAPWAKAFRTLFALALLPEMTIGLFALTPDLPLAVTWLAALGCAALALGAAPGRPRALVATLFAGLFAGLAVTAKASGVLLVLSLVAAFASRPARAHLRTAAPWCGLVVVAILVTPLVAWEWQHGWPLLAHRLVATQARAGFSPRNLGALVGGQLLYVTPAFLLGAWRVLRALLRERDDAVTQLLVLSTAIPGVTLVVLCLWSRVAEPHWLAPAYLGLALGVSRVDVVGRGLRVAGVATGLFAALAGWLVVATPVLPRALGKGYVPRYDLVNDLFAWRVGLPLVESELAELAGEGRRPIVVGPHWIVCAQVAAAIGSRADVGCRTPEGDDFTTWLPAAEWSKAKTLLFVTDDRFTADPARDFPERDVVRVSTGHVYRGGRRVRTIRVSRLDRSGVAAAP
jgi:hypothetical protein